MLSTYKKRKILIPAAVDGISTAHYDPSVYSGSSGTGGSQSSTATGNAVYGKDYAAEFKQNTGASTRSTKFAADMAAGDPNAAGNFTRSLNDQYNLKEAASGSLGGGSGNDGKSGGFRAAETGGGANVGGIILASTPLVGMVADSIWGTSNAKDKRDVAAKTATGILSGAAAGASLGSVVPGIGTAVGAIGGAVIGSIGQSGRKAEFTSFTDYDEGTLGTGLIGAFSNGRLRRRRREIRNNAYRNKAAVQGTANLLSEYNNEYGDMNVNSFYEGGMLPSSLAYVDDGELIQTPDGTINKVPEQGKPTDSNLINLPKGSKILSDHLKVPGTKKTFAQMGEEMMTKRKSKGTDRFAENAAKLNEMNNNMIHDLLFALQEEVKNRKGIKPKTKTLEYQKGGQVPAYDNGNWDENLEEYMSIYGDVRNGLVQKLVDEQNRVISENASFRTKKPSLQQLHYSARNDKSYMAAYNAVRDEMYSMSRFRDKASNGITPLTNTNTKSLPVTFSATATPVNSTNKSKYNKWGYNKDIKAFSGWDAKTNDYTPQYRLYVEDTVTDEYIKEVLAGEHGDISAYKAANPNYIPSTQEVKSWMLDGKYGNWHKIGLLSYLKAFTEKLPKLGDPVKIWDSSVKLPTGKLSFVLTNAPSVKSPNTKGNKLRMNKLLGTLGNVATDLASLAPIMSNLFTSNPEAVQANYNPYAQAIANTMGRRRYNIDPAMQDVLRNRANSNYNIRNTNTNTGSNLAFALQSQMNTDKAILTLRSQESNVNNAYAGEYANVMNNLGQQWVAETNRVQEANAANRAAARNIRRTGMTQLGQWALNKELMRNTERRDEQMLPLYKRFLDAGFTKAEVDRIIV